MYGVKKKLGREGPFTLPYAPIAVGEGGEQQGPEDRHLRPPNAPRSRHLIGFEGQAAMGRSEHSRYCLVEGYEAIDLIW